MIRVLRQRIGTLRAILALLVLVFATTPALEAFACAAEGCGIACLAQSDGPTLSDKESGSSEACTDQSCLCASGHVHSANLPAVSCGELAPRIVEPVTAADPDRFVSAPQSSLERPPRS
jgi:hypothetical protein